MKITLYRFTSYKLTKKVVDDSDIESAELNSFGKFVSCKPYSEWISGPCGYMSKKEAKYEEIAETELEIKRLQKYLKVLRGK